MPKEMPFYGTQAFREVAITMYIRKSSLEAYTYDQFAIMVAHDTFLKRNGANIRRSKNEVIVDLFREKHFL